MKLNRADPERAAVEHGGREGHVRQALIIERDLEPGGLDQVARTRAVTVSVAHWAVVS